jgi:hypothetical protein
MESDDEYWSDSSAPLDYDSDEFDFGNDDIIFPPSQDNVEAIQQEERDFLFEALIILQKYNDLETPPPRFGRFRLHKVITTGHRIKSPYVDLYNFLAISLLRRKDDIAAVAGYLTAGGASIYWCKNTLDASDKAQAEEMAKFLQTSVRDNLTPTSFARCYFDILVKHCGEYIQESLCNIKTVFMGKDGESLFTKAMEFLEKSSSRDSGVWSKVDTTIEKKLETLGRNQKNVYLNIRILLEDIKCILTEDKFESLQFQRLSSLFDFVLRSSAALSLKWIYGEELETFKNFSRYTEGIRLLYKILMDKKFNHRWQNIELNMVPSSSVQVHSLCQDAFWVLQCVYFRLYQRPLNLSKEQFSVYNPNLLSLPPTINTSAPCEKVLIQHLMTIGRPATKVGVSRPSCDSCLKWVESLNQNIHVRNSRWVIQGTMEKILCQLAECTNEMQDTIYSALMRMISTTKAQIRRNWRNKNGHSYWDRWGDDLMAKMGDHTDAGNSSSLNDDEESYDYKLLS